MFLWHRGLQVLPSGSSRMTRRPFLQTTFPVEASINIREGMLETLYLFHSFSCKKDWEGFCFVVLNFSTTPDTAKVESECLLENLKTS